MTTHYKRIPELAAYIDRIGAEELNFRRFIVREYRGHYYTEKALIRIVEDGGIKCPVPKYAPTKEEAEAIKVAIMRDKEDLWPKAAGAPSLELLKDKVGDNVVFPFWNATRTHIIMAQERKDTEKGKVYVPWTFFSDGEWKMMEPDGHLPFWKPQKSRNLDRLMVHEGAKAAAFVDALVNDPRRAEEKAKHPWGAELSAYEHWGMIGGALAPHRSDYSELTSQKPVEVIYVCDNDNPGIRALQDISFRYGQPLKGIIFDGDYPTCFDLADPMPKSLFSKSGKWKGQKLSAHVRPATYATEDVPVPDSKKMVKTIKKAFRDEWLHCITPDVFVHRDSPSWLLTPSEFDDYVAPFSGVDSTARLMRKDSTTKTAVLKYSPGRDAKIYSDSGGRYINTHVPSDIDRVEGDPTPFIEFIKDMVPLATDAKELLRWVATLIARPGIKMLYGILLISETQGVGKSTLGEKILAPLMGPGNASAPSESDIVDSNYNYWMPHKRLAVVHEIYGGHQSKGYDRLKSAITDKNLTVSKKYMASYDIENWVHVFACSNSMRAIKLSGDDRRWLVPLVTEEKRPVEYWMALNEWLTEDEGLGIIKNWAHVFLETEPPVMPGEPAPWSSAKAAVVEEGYSPGQSTLAEVLVKTRTAAAQPGWLEAHAKPKDYQGDWQDNGFVMIDKDLRGVIKDQVYDGREAPTLEKTPTCRKVAKELGFFIHPARVMINGDRNIRLVCSNETLQAMPVSNITKIMKPIAIRQLAQNWRTP